MANLLTSQAATASAAPYDGWKHYEGWDLLRDKWARLNGIKRSRTEISLDALVRRMRSGGQWGHYYHWPDGRDLCDHPSSFTRDQRAAAVTTELYNLADFERALAYAPSIGLVAHTPPKPEASFWFPGYTRLVVLTRPDFGEVQWLPDQLTFAGLVPIRDESA